MKKGKVFLAKALAAAIMITSLLPVNLLSVNAAEVLTSEYGWKVQKDYEKWSSDFDDFLNLDGIQTWQIKSEDDDVNINGDMSAKKSPAFVYAKNIDITASSNSSDPKRVISFDILPKHDPEQAGSTASRMRFGVFLKYVDATHWVYLGNENTDHWFLEWNYGGSTGFKDLEGVNGAFELEDDIYHRVIIEYVSGSQINLEMWKMKESPAESGNWITSGTPYKADMKDAAFNGTNMFQKLRDYAGVTSQSPKPIHFGFKGATGNTDNGGDSIIVTPTVVDIANVQTNANKDHEMRSLRYGYCGWTSPKGKDPRKVMSVNSDGGINYVSIDATTGSAPKTVGYVDDALDDFSEGTVSAVFRPYTSDMEKEDTAIDKAFYLNARAVTPDSPEGTVRVGFDGTNWGYQLGNGSWVNASGNAEAPKYMHEYKMDLTLSADNKLSAEVIEVVRSGSENEKAEDYEENDYSQIVTGASPIKIAEEVNLSEANGVSEAGSISITAGKDLVLRFRNVNYEKKGTMPATEFLGADYTEVMNRNNNDYTYYTAAWNAFHQVRAAADAKLKADGVLTPQGATKLLQQMQAAWTALDVDVNKIAPDRLLLKDAQDDLTAKSDKTYYSYDEAKFNEAKSAVDAMYAQVSMTPAGAVKEEVTAALAKYNALNITPVTATPEDLKNASDAVENATDGVDDAEAEFYENWDAYKDALEAVKALNSNSTKKEVDEALAALAEAVANRTLKAADQADKDDLKNKIAAIKAEVAKNLQPNAAYNAALQKAESLANGAEATTKKALADALKALEAAKNSLPKKAVTNVVKLTKGQKAKFNNNDYVVVDPQKKTVSLTSWNGNKKKLKKVTVPDRVTINGESCTVVSIGKNAFKGYGKLTKLTFGATVETIEKGAVSGSKNLTSVTFKNGNTKVSKGAFKGCKKKVTVKVPKAVKKNKKAKKNFEKMIKKAGLKKVTVK